MRIAMLCAGMLFVASAFADTLVFKDGSVLDGGILRENDTYLRLKTDKEELCIWKEDLSEPTPFDQKIADYKARVARINKDSADEHRVLAQACKELGLTEEAQFHFEEVLRITPSDAQVGIELKLTPGADGKYLTERQAKEQKGLVRYFGEWMTREDQAKYAKGLVKLRGAWKGKAESAKAIRAEQARQQELAEARRAEAAKQRWAGKIDAEDKAVKEQLGKDYRADYVDGFLVRTNVPEKDCQAFYRMIAAYRRQFLKDFGQDLGIRYEEPINVFWFSDRETYLTGIKTVDPGSMDIAMRGSGFSNTNRGSIEESRIYLFRSDADGAKVKAAVKWVNYISTFYHELFHFYLAALTWDRSDNTIGVGLNEGVASFLEGSVFNDKTGSFDWGKKNPDRLKAGREGRKQLDLAQVLRMSSAEFNGSPVATSIVLYGVVENFVHYLIHQEQGKHRAGFLKFIASYGRGSSGEKEPDRIRRLEQCVGIPLSQMQKECDEHTARRQQ